MSKEFRLEIGRTTSFSRKEDRVRDSFGSSVLSEMNLFTKFRDGRGEKDQRSWQMMGLG